MQIVTTKTFDKLFKTPEKRIQRKAAKRTEIFKQNPFHAILQIEKLHPKTHGVWSLCVDFDHRIVFKFLAADIAEFRFIGHHNKIYDYPIFL